MARPCRGTWVAGGLNDAFQYGILDGVGPTVVDAGDGIAVVAGNTIDIAYLSGLTSALAACRTRTRLVIPRFTANDAPGSTGEVFPSFYMSPYPIYLNALVGTFADATGTIVGTPFHIGLGGSFVYPAGRRSCSSASTTTSSPTTRVACVSA